MVQTNAVSPSGYHVHAQGAFAFVFACLHMYSFSVIGRKSPEKCEKLDLETIVYKIVGQNTIN